jgi:isochorismate hydrolase
MILHSLGVEDLIIGGVTSNLCCETTARDAFVRDFNVFFLADGTAAADEALHQASLKNIAYGFGRVMGVTEAMETLGATSLKNG